MKKILITGASGYLGSHLCYQISKSNYKTVGIYKTTKPSIHNIELVNIDILKENELKNLFNTYKFDVVIHLAAVTPVGSIDSSEDYIYKVNVNVTKTICQLANAFGSLLIFSSSDLVYQEGDNLKEDSQLNPLTTYSKSKLEAENSIREISHSYIILRTSLMYGFTISERRSFFDTSFAMLKRGEKVKAFSDQFRNPLFVEDAARLLIQILSTSVKNETINFCGWEKLSRYEMAKMTAEVFGFDSNLVLPTSSEEFTQYKMVKNIGLNFEKMKRLNLIPNLCLDNLKYLKRNIKFYF